MWSFVKNKRNKQWLWIALDQNPREIVGLYIGARSKKSASEFWQSLPPVYRQCAVCYTNFWESYSEVLPFKRHRPVGKESRKTSYMERLNNTLRQRISRCRLQLTLLLVRLLSRQLNQLRFSLNFTVTNWRQSRILLIQG